MVIWGYGDMGIRYNMGMWVYGIIWDMVIRGYGDMMILGYGDMRI